MRKLLNYIIIICLSFTLFGCQKTLKGTNELIDKALEEIELPSDMNDFDISYLGLYSKDNSALIWFVVEGRDEKLYWAMECNIVGKDEYRYVRMYTSMPMAADIRFLHWKDDEYVFLVNNPNCKTMRFIDNTEIEEITIEKESVPIIYTSQVFPNKCEILDENGNIIY